MKTPGQTEGWLYFFTTIVGTAGSPITIVKERLAE